MSSEENKNYYLKVSRASDLAIAKERWLYRFLEMFPGAFSWLTLLTAVALSFLAPAIIAVFIIIFSCFWVLRTLYFYFHLWFGYRRMEEYRKKNWFEELKSLPKENYSLPIGSWNEIYHLVIITVYKEPLAIIREAVRAIEKADYPKNRIMVVLACEQRAREKNEIIANEIEKEFKNSFYRFLVSWHPDNLPNEIAGKGSNESWAAKEAKEKLIDQLGLAYENITVSSFDADTIVSPGYFGCLSWHYLTTENPTRASYQPIPLYTNNILSAPAISRVFSFSSSFWQIMNQERPEKIMTFSSHSMSFKALVEVGFKDAKVVSDDSRIFWQCFLQFDGNYRVIPLFYPVSMDANVAGTLWQTMVNIYKQQKRWAYGVGEIPYCLFGFLKNKKIPLKKKLSFGFEIIEGHWSWAIAPLLIFFFGWLPIILGGQSFSQTMLSYSLPKMVSRISTIAMVGIVLSAYFSVLITPQKEIIRGKLRLLFFASGWFLIPVIMIVFSSLPALAAQTNWLLGRYMGFWNTDKSR